MFQEEEADFLLATDLASRGLDLRRPQRGHGRERGPRTIPGGRGVRVLPRRRLGLRVAAAAAAAAKKTRVKQMRAQGT